MNEQDIVDYLAENPDFFNRHAHVLNELAVPHPEGGRTISIVERQVLGLREKHQALGEKMSELLQFGERNDQISEKVHQLALHLVQARDFDELSDSLMPKMCETFDVPQVTWRLWGWPVYPGMEGRDPFVMVPEEIRARVSAMDEPYSGPPRGMNWLNGWVLDLPPSLALAPLAIRQGRSAGALLFISGDAQRFQVDMGNIYIERIADLISVALDRVLLD